MTAHCPSLRARLRQPLGLLRTPHTLACIALLTLVVAATTVLIVHRANQATLAQERDRELGETMRAAAALSSRVLELQDALVTVTAELNEHMLLDQPVLERFLSERIVLRRLFSNVSVVAPDGKVRAYVDRDGVHAVRNNLADTDHFREVMVNAAPVISQVFTSRADALPMVVFSQPLRGPRGVYGVLNGAVNLGNGDLIAKVLQYRGIEEPDALLVVTDEQGRVLAHPDRSRVLLPLSAEPRLSQAWNDWVHAGRPLEPSGVSVQQEGEVVTVAAVAGPQWLVWRALPEAQLLAPLHETRKHLLAWAAVIVVISSVAMLVLLDWLLRPMRALERRAQRLFDPALDPHAGWPKVDGELGRLAHLLRHASAEHVQLEEFNADLLQRLECVMAAAPVGIAFTRHERFELVNAEFCCLLGRQPGELVGQSLDLLGIEQGARQTLLCRVYRAFLNDGRYSGEWQLQRADGSRFWAQLRVQPARAGEPALGLIWSVLDISTQVAARMQLEWSAYHDALTGLANRAAFERQVCKVFAARPLSIPAVLVAVDLDHFKPINDGAGHAAGDAMLKAVAAAICSCVRAGDLVARLGGDEFVLLLERCSPGRALSIANAVCAAVAAIELPWEEQVLRVGASAGLATLQAEMTEVAHWLKAADRACYDAKAAGRGQARTAKPVPDKSEPMGVTLAC